MQVYRVFHNTYTGVQGVPIYIYMFTGCSTIHIQVYRVLYKHKQVHRVFHKQFIYRFNGIMFHKTT